LEKSPLWQILDPVMQCASSLFARVSLRVPNGKPLYLFLANMAEFGLERRFQPLANLRIRMCVSWGKFRRRHMPLHASVLVWAVDGTKAGE
jgi:hypothetical protein